MAGLYASSPSGARSWNTQRSWPGRNSGRTRSISSPARSTAPSKTPTPRRSSRPPSLVSRPPSKTTPINEGFKSRRQLPSTPRWTRPWTPCIASTAWCPTGSKGIRPCSANGMPLGAFQPHAARKALTLHPLPKLRPRMPRRNGVRSAKNPLRHPQGIF